MTYQTQQQFATNRLTKEAQAAADKSEVVGELTAPERPVELESVTPTPAVSLVTPEAEKIDPPKAEVIQKIQTAAAGAMASDGRPASLQPLETLIST
jgi:hypothetical protein